MPSIAKWLALAFIALNTACAPGPGNSTTKEINIGDRKFLLVDPSNVKGKAPLVLALHGGFGSADYFERALPLEKQAAAKGFRVAYLEGTGSGPRGNRARSWNAGSCCGPAQKNRVDDIGYINSVVSALKKQGMVSQVAMVGHSNGAMMIYRYLCEGGTSVASAVIISGSKMVKGCRLSGRTKVMIVHGQKDSNVPIAGGKGKGPSGASYASLKSSVGGLSAGGASVSEKLLPGAGHKLGEIDSNIAKETKTSLPNFVANFMFGG